MYALLKPILKFCTYHRIFIYIYIYINPVVRTEFEIYLILYIYIYIYICIFWQHYFVNTNFIKHNRHFMSTYFLLDPFEFPYYFYRIRRELIYVLSIVVSVATLAYFCYTWTPPPALCQLQFPTCGPWSQSKSS